MIEGRFMLPKGFDKTRVENKVLEVSGEPNPRGDRTVCSRE